MGARPGIVGAFILGAMALGVAAILFFGGTSIFTKTSVAVVFFDESLAGLEVGAPVTFHGVRIGSVKNIAVRVATDTLTARIPVLLEFDPKLISWEGSKPLGGGSRDYQRLVQAGLRAQLALQSLVTGQVRVDLEFQPGSPANLTGASLGVPEIPSLPSQLGQFWARLTQLRLQELADTTQHAFASFDRLANHVDAALDPLVTNANQTLVQARATLATAEGAVHQLQGEASTALHHLDLLLVDGRRQVGARGADLSRTLASADRAARAASDFLESLNGLVDPQAPFRASLEAAARDIADAAASMRSFTATIDRNPGALLAGATR